MRPDLKTRVAATVTAYLGYDPGPLALVPDAQHPAAPVACRVMGQAFPTDFLVHAPYTVGEVEEVVFTAWPPRSWRS